MNGNAVISNPKTQEKLGFFNKYGDLNINAKIKRKYDLTTQLLHAYKIVLNGKEIEDQLPQRFEANVKDNFNV